MAHYTSLDIFKQTKNAVIMMLKEANKIPKSYKFIIGDDIKNNSLKMLQSIYDINKAKNKLHAMDEMERAYECVKLDWQLCKELNLVSNKAIGLIGLNLNEISNQLKKWRNYEEKRLGKKI